MQGHEFIRQADGSNRLAVRNDAIRLTDPPRHYVPTSDQTKWISTIAELREAGGTICFSEDQSYAEIVLPAPYKLAIGFPSW